MGKVYRILGTSLRHFNTAYEDVLERISDNGKSVIIGEDQNIDLLKGNDHPTSNCIDLKFALGMSPIGTNATGVTYKTLIGNHMGSPTALSHLIFSDLERSKTRSPNI